MKEATGEVSMTVVTLVAIGVIGAINNYIKKTFLKQKLINCALFKYFVYIFLIHINKYS